METKTYFDQIQFPESHNSEATTTTTTTNYVINNDVTINDVAPGDVMLEEYSRPFSSLPRNMPSSSRKTEEQLLGTEEAPKPKKKKKKKKAKVHREFIEEEIIFVRLDVDGNEQIVRETVVRPISQLLDEKQITQSAQNEDPLSIPSNADGDCSKKRSSKRNIISSKCDTFPRSFKKPKICDQICLNDIATEVSKSVFRSENREKAKSELNLGDLDDTRLKEIHENVILILVNDRENGTSFVLKPTEEPPAVQSSEKPLFVDTGEITNTETPVASSFSSSTTPRSQPDKKTKKKKKRRRVIREIEWIEEEIIIIRIDAKGVEHYVKETVRRPSRVSLVESRHRNRKKPIIPSEVPHLSNFEMNQSEVPAISTEIENSGNKSWFEEEVLVSRLDESGKKTWVREVVRRPSLPAISLLGQSGSFETSTFRPSFLKSQSTDNNPLASSVVKELQILPNEDIAECSEVESGVTTECSDMESVYSGSNFSSSTVDEKQDLHSDVSISDVEIFPMSCFNNESSNQNLPEVDENATPKRVNHYQKCNIPRSNQLPINAANINDVFDSEDEVLSARSMLDVGGAFRNMRTESQEHETDFNIYSISATPESCPTVHASPNRSQSKAENFRDMPIHFLNSMQDVVTGAKFETNDQMETTDSLQCSLKLHEEQNFKAKSCPEVSNIVHTFPNSISGTDKCPWAEEINISNELLSNISNSRQYNKLHGPVSESSCENSETFYCAFKSDAGQLVFGSLFDSSKPNRPEEPVNELFEQTTDSENKTALEPECLISYLVSALDLQPSTSLLAKYSKIDTSEIELGMDCTCRLQRVAIRPGNVSIQKCGCLQSNVGNEGFLAEQGRLCPCMHLEKPVEQYAEASLTPPCCTFSQGTSTGSFLFISAFLLKLD